MKNIQINDIKSLAHTQWNCKYHIVFAPKYRREIFYESKRLEIGKILRQLSHQMTFEDFEPRVANKECDWRSKKKPLQ